MSRAPGGSHIRVTAGSDHRAVRAAGRLVPDRVNRTARRRAGYPRAVPETAPAVPATGSRTATVLVASNRGPVAFTAEDDGSLRLRRGSGGLVSGLRSVTADGEAMWV